MSSEVTNATERVFNLTKSNKNLSDRVSNIELVMDMEVSVRN
jgi:hypothetical protein